MIPFCHERPVARYEMSTAVEIERAREILPPAEYAKLLAWLDERRANQVDAAFEEAVFSGKFDSMSEQAKREIDAGEFVPLKEFLRQRR